MQTIALLTDSFRMMVARRMFWVTLGINVLVVLVYGSIGTNDEGLTMLFGLFDIGIPMFANDSPVYDSLMQGIFSGMLVPVWLAWIATILALISTTSVFPDFQEEGAIDVVLSKPISRWKIFFVKYLGSLVFVLLQVAIFCIGVFLVVGMRVGDWNWTILAGIPIVLLFYSYLYSFNTLIGVFTRSSIAALLFTILFWFMLFLVNSAENTLNVFRSQSEISVQQFDQRIAAAETRLERTERPQSLLELGTTSFNDPESLRRRIDSLQEQRASEQKTYEAFSRWHGAIRTSLAVLPKTRETIGLLDRWVRSDLPYTLTEIFEGDAQREFDGVAPSTPGPVTSQIEEDALDLDETEEPISRMEQLESNDQLHREVTDRVQEDYDNRSPWFVIGTSLGFEAVILLIGGWIFVRRDY